MLRDSSSSEVRRTVKLELDEKEAADTATKEKVGMLIIHIHFPL